MACMLGAAVVMQCLMYTNGLTDASSVEITARDGFARFVFGI